MTTLDHDEDHDRDDPSPVRLRPGDWFTTEDPTVDDPSFLRDPEEMYYRAHEQHHRPPHGMPLQVIVVHGSHIYATTLNAGGHTWCPVIVDTRLHSVVPLPRWVAERISTHLRGPRDRRKTRTASSETEDAPLGGRLGAVTPAEDALGRRRERNRAARAQAATGQDRTDDALTTDRAPAAEIPANLKRVTVEDLVGPNAPPAPAASATPSPNDATTVAADRETDPWLHLHLRFNPRAMGRDLARFLRDLAACFTRRSRNRRQDDRTPPQPTET